MEKKTPVRRKSVIDYLSLSGSVWSKMQKAIQNKKTLIIHMVIKDGRFTVDYDGVIDYK